MNLSNQDVQLGQQMYTSSAASQHALGQRGSDAYGRVYRYVKAGAVDLIAGNIIQSSAVVAGHLTLAVNTTSNGTNIGSLSFAVTAASTVAANYYSDGFAVIATGAGQGVGPYVIQSHLAVSTGATGVFNLYAEDAIVIAITTTSKISLIANKYSGVIQMPATTATGVIVGVAVSVITAAQYGWIQTWGPCSVYGADTNAVGSWVQGPATACGQATSMTAASLLTGQVIGHLMQANVAQQYVAVDLTISP